MKNPVLAVMAGMFVVAPALAGELEDRAAKSRAAAGAFMGALVGELQAAMKDGGPVNAIQICNTRAPQIAADISKQQGFRIARTSLKLRNPKNAPDAWEEKVLRDFEARRARGEELAQMEHAEIVSAGGKREFRYMKAIGILPNAPCLACHGTTIDPAVAARLKTLYPQDRATGYQTGDVRGAYTIRQAL